MHCGFVICERHGSCTATAGYFGSMSAWYARRILCRFLVELRRIWPKCGEQLERWDPQDRRALREVPVRWDRQGRRASQEQPGQWG